MNFVESAKHDIWGRELWDVLHGKVDTNNEEGDLWKHLHNLPIASVQDTENDIKISLEKDATLMREFTDSWLARPHVPHYLRCNRCPVVPDEQTPQACSICKYEYAQCVVCPNLCVPRCCEYHTHVANQLTLCYTCYTRLTCHRCGEYFTVLTNHVCEDCQNWIAVDESH
jgi:hypothetical protein